MPSHTRYLKAVTTPDRRLAVEIVDSSPGMIAQQAVNESADLRYSPIMPAFVAPREKAPPVPNDIRSIAFLFSGSPYTALGTIKGLLTSEEFVCVYFSEGLASIILVNFALDRAREIVASVGGCPLEYWPVKNQTLEPTDIILDAALRANTATPVELAVATDPELDVYVEQISASMAVLWSTYGTYLPNERETLRQIAHITTGLIDQFRQIRATPATVDSLVKQKQANAIVSALVELSAALSYAVTQGTSGCMPILSNHSPFPHHSLLGIGGSVRALIKFVRHLEAAFALRSADMMITKRYSELTWIIPASLAKYESGDEYKLSVSSEKCDETFDGGGDFPEVDTIPLIAHFSLRHGFMESKFSVTAASESLTAETEPQWTLMTLSHEVMHSRVRSIFQALFGAEWNEDQDEVIQPDHHHEFISWIRQRRDPQPIPVATGLRNVILNFCYAVEQYPTPVLAADDPTGLLVSLDKLRECYSRHKQLAVEIVVHFHDYYFAYAYQRKMYIMSIWASWIKVAAPYTRTLEYLTRSLATVACGSGLDPRSAFDLAVETLLDGLDALEASGVRSPLFAELRRRVQSKPEVESTRALFKVFYYLIDQIRLFFASPLIAAKIDRIEEDPFAEGSASAADYSSNIYVFREGEDEAVSPIRYSLAALFRALSRDAPVDDPQWLTAWNYMVLSS